MLKMLFIAGGKFNNSIVMLSIFRKEISVNGNKFQHQT